MIYLSKSKYCGLWQCPKIAWLRKYKPEEWVLDDGTLARMDAGNEVGDLAMGLFGDFVEVTAYTDGKLDLQKMMDETEAEMAKGTPIICEAWGSTPSSWPMGLRACGSRGNSIVMSRALIRWARVPSPKAPSTC